MTEQRIEDPARREEQTPRIPRRRPGRVEEVAKLAGYLASPDADDITGQSLTINGGLEMNGGQGV